jgi:mono/diheme cytochrome c family protein
MAIVFKLLKMVIVLVVLVAAAGLALVLWIRYSGPRPGSVQDEAQAAGLTAEAFRAADEDYFREMDRVASPGGPQAPQLTPEEVKGRNAWIVWTAGNDRMWDELGNVSFGALDLLKTLSSHQSLGYGRQNRWEYLGLVNEPCFDAATSTDESFRFGLRLDRRRQSAECGSDPFENSAKYPGVSIGARASRTLRWRGRDVEFGAGSSYGYATGVVGLRLFPNPNFDQAAADRWDPDRYYTDPTYYGDSKLIKPYRVAMSCGFCHVGPNPINPPPDPNAPEWQHLSSNVGAQYFWVDRILYWQNKPEDFAFQLFHSSRPGTLDTSFISTDNINNPRSMNAVYLLGPRLDQATRTGRETLAGGGLDNRQFNDLVSSGPLTRLFETPDTVWTPRVLKDGSDSVGALGALNRVYLNIGTFSEEWLLHFNALIGGKPVTPIEIAVARRNSAYFAATENQTLDMARFFLRTTEAHRLRDAPGGAAYLAETTEQIARGKTVFAETCARCHSSKAPAPPPPVLQPDRCAGKAYLDCWNEYWAWTETPAFKEQMRTIVNADDFLEGNYLSTELRVPVTLLETNACSPLATNAIGGNIWDNFSSQSYKDLPSVGTITWYHPYTGRENTYTMPAGGRGYTRPPSLVSLWSTAPFLLNNTVGPFESSPSVEARMRSFQASIEEMLWPERRVKDSNPTVAAAVPGPSLIDRVGDRLPSPDSTRAATITATTGFLPPSLQRVAGLGARFFPRFFDEGGVRLGPIPPGTPIGLLSNLLLLPESDDEAAREEHEDRVRDFVVRFLRRPLDLSGGTPESLATIDELLGLSKCPDLIVNRGHYFGRDLSDADKRALIGFLKMF